MKATEMQKKQRAAVKKLFDGLKKIDGPPRRPVMDQSSEELSNGTHRGDQRKKSLPPQQSAQSYSERHNMKKLAAALVLVGGLAVWIPSARAEGYPADNSGKNVRDRKDWEVTSGDQSNKQSDLNITQEIRKAVIADKELSVNAHNIKIITANGVVTLRGPVKNAEEKANIEAKAEHATGVTRVNNQIEIASD